VVAAPVDIQMYTKGKELNASRELLSRIAETFGKSFVDIVIGDGLYISKDHIIQSGYGLAPLPRRVQTAPISVT